MYISWLNKGKSIDVANSCSNVLLKSFIVLGCQMSGKEEQEWHSLDSYIFFTYPPQIF